MEELERINSEEEEETETRREETENMKEWKECVKAVNDWAELLKEVKLSERPRETKEASRLLHTQGIGANTLKTAMNRMDGKK